MSTTGAPEGNFCITCPFRTHQILISDDASSPAHTSSCRWSPGYGTSLVRASSFCREPPWNVCTMLQLQPPMPAAPDIVAEPDSRSQPNVSSHIWCRTYGILAAGRKVARKCRDLASTDRLVRLPANSRQAV
ncbi:hypothetical protein NP493_89g00004 [Ridgeia piscesae]|uniref:Uncharacterized protein n=1 Tax=Ridgeia piscesae TaxID=27915 RepID=A0AAD9P8L3_RIDPI|nr:hypothetical protein NP493_89g00004 [Ridgeia piscesae]